MLAKDEEIVGAQMSYIPSFDELDRELQNYLERCMPEPQRRTVAWSMNLMVDPQYHNERLAFGLMSVFRDWVFQKYSWGGAIILSKISRGNQALEFVARAIGQRPTGLYAPSCSNRPFEDFQYWLMILDPISLSQQPES